MRTIIECEPTDSVEVQVGGDGRLWVNVNASCVLRVPAEASLFLTGPAGPLPHAPPAGPLTLNPAEARTVEALLRGAATVAHPLPETWMSPSAIEALADRLKKALTT